jgi:beta-glucosidase
MNFISPAEVAAVQKAARESRLGIPLLIGLDAVHGVSTYFPLPLGQAATFNPALVEEAALWTGREARALGVNWTFAPMVDMGRDPRWGRLLEGAGEDVHLANVIAAARTRGYQAGGVAATVKHFVGYGGGEAGRDYNTAWIPAEQLHDLHLPPFRASLDAGSLSVMAAFNSVNGVPWRQLVKDIYPVGADEAAIVDDFLGDAGEGRHGAFEVDDEGAFLADAC